MESFVDKRLSHLSDAQLQLIDIQPYFKNIINPTITDRIIICDLSKQYDYCTCQPFDHEFKQHGKYRFDLKTDPMKDSETKDNSNDNDEEEKLHPNPNSNLPTTYNDLFGGQ